MRTYMDRQTTIIVLSPIMIGYLLFYSLTGCLWVAIAWENKRENVAGERQVDYVETEEDRFRLKLRDCSIHYTFQV